MEDSKTTVQQVKQVLDAFVAERDWHQFHSPKNLSMLISAEAAELMEKFLWMENAASHDEITKNRQEIEDELADVIITSFMFANVAKIDISKVIAYKMAKNAQKYPVQKAKGVYTKYTQL
jgi:dCTP diphosphatase